MLPAATLYSLRDYRDVRNTKKYLQRSTQQAHSATTRANGELPLLNRATRPEKQRKHDRENGHSFSAEKIKKQGTGYSKEELISATSHNRLLYDVLGYPLSPKFFLHNSLLCKLARLRSR